MKSKIIKALNISILSIVLFACTSKNENTDQDGKLIKTVEIGKQIWSCENLNVVHFRNGDEIPEAKTWDEYFKYTTDKKPCWSYYDFDKKNEKIYGKLYNWYAVKDKRNLAPEGFKVSSVEDWNELIEFLGNGETSASQLKSVETNLWLNQSNNVKDSHGFCAKPGGFLTCSTDMGDSFWSLRRVGAWWCSNSIDENNANSIYMYSGDNEYSTENEIKIAENQKWFALSVRIISEKKSDKKAQEKTIQLSGSVTKIMTYQYCECNDMCYSLFTDEEGNEYDFGDISSQSNIGFQCYPNNSEGGISDDLKGRKFKVTYIKIAEKDFELVKILSMNNLDNEYNVFVQNNKTKQNSKVTFSYDKNVEGNRPCLSINFLDGFELFNYVLPVCEGEYCWCLRDENNEDIAYLKINIEGDKLISSFKFDEKINSHSKKQFLIEHIELLDGIFIKSK
jgi:uncharacterized protein (TIGR02145 family)